MKQILIYISLLLSLSVLVLAQDGRYEGQPVYDARSNYWPVGLLTNSMTQDPIATFTFTRKISAPTQKDADQKLASYLAAYLESRGKSRDSLCAIVNGKCLEQGGQVVYELEKVSQAMGQILDADLLAAFKSAFSDLRVRDARTKAEADFEKEAKPDKGTVKPAARPTFQTRRLRR